MHLPKVMSFINYLHSDKQPGKYPNAISAGTKVVVVWSQPQAKIQWKSRRRQWTVMWRVNHKANHKSKAILGFWLRMKIKSKQYTHFNTQSWSTIQEQHLDLDLKTWCKAKIQRSTQPQHYKKDCVRPSILQQQKKIGKKTHPWTGKYLTNSKSKYSQRLCRHQEPEWCQSR